MGEETIMSAQDLLRNSRWCIRAGRVFAGAVGLVLIVAALLKAPDMELFVREIKEYGIFSDRLVLIFIAWGLIVVELALGVGLIVVYRPKILFPMTTLLWVIFIGATGSAWITGATENCGCFGAWLKRTPGEAVVEDLILLTATVLAWACLRRSQVSQTRAKTWAVSSACLIGLVLPAAFGFPISGIRQPQLEAVETKIGQFPIQGLEHVDLNNGAYLIVVMATDCLHCQEAVPAIDMLAETVDLTSVIGLCANDEDERATFVETFQPVFPIGQVDQDVFWRLLADGDLPRVMLVRDGRVKRVWDNTVPDEEMVRAENPS
jgi:hypothetical protein